ncbi:MAG: hypothetical protein INR73_03765 [Williamsia sp.]|nr:hypothetical protein [Williamsia sp.]
MNCPLPYGRILFLWIFVLASTRTAAQSYNNEWIDYSKAYYKFKIAETGLYRINQPALNGAGLGNTPAEQFKLFRNGVEVPLYTSVATGPLPAGGYIEFWGEMNDGKPDKPLYREASAQHTDKVSLQSDTSVYFLTTAAGSNLRLNEVANNVAGNTLRPEPYFMYTAGTYYKDRLNPGYAVVIGEYLYSSSYDRGEFWSSQEITPASSPANVLNNLFVYQGNPQASIRFGASGNSQNSRSVRVAINGSTVKDTVMDYFNDMVVQATVPISLLASNTASVQFINTSATGSDRMVVSFYELSYPRLFNFGGARSMEFQLPAKSEGYYLEITNFNAGSQPPVLYDVNNGERYTGNLSGTTIRFALRGTASARQLVLVNEESTNIKSIESLTRKTFVNLTSGANQGNYLIISNPILYNGSSGNNPVIDYKNYRSSQTGGRFNAQVYEIDELTDQFAFGIKKHPLSVRNFLRFARDKFATKPQFALLIGRGVTYNEYRANQADPLAERLNLVPTFGNPGSDNMLSTASVTSTSILTPIGRLSVVTPKELEDFLEKLKEYESAQKTAQNTIQGRLWMKNAIHLTGASDSYLGTVLCDYMGSYKRIIEDTLTGANVSVFCKTSTSTVEQLSNDKITELFQQGLSMVTYFGHSSATTLEFNLDNPQNYNNQGKYPVFSVNGCNAGNFFTFDQQRFTYNETLSEKFTLAKQRGSIAFLASTHYGIVNYLNIYLTAFYSNLSKPQYGATLGELLRNALQQVTDVSGTNDYYARMQTEQTTLHGDPALVMNFEALPDYVIEEPQVKISPSFISIAENKFNVAVSMYNLGKAVKDSITVNIKRQYPNGTVETIYNRKIRGIRYSDSLLLEIPVVATRDKGQNKLIISVDADNIVSEVSENNNTVTKEFFIYEDEARPAFPYNYSIVNNASQPLFASTANPFSPSKQYVVEVDTTELFNSSQKIVKNTTAAGGVMQFDPGITYRDSTVYYWRISLVPATPGDYHWNTSSFIYQKGTTTGFNQSHYFQHRNSTLDHLAIDSTSRSWKFTQKVNNLFLKNTTYPTGSPNQGDYVNSINGSNILGPGCEYDEIIFQIIDPVRFTPWRNDFSGASGLYGSSLATCGSTREYNFDFPLGNAASRKRAMDFIDQIPAGSFVIVRSNTVPDDAANTYSAVWKKDTALYGAGKSLYHKLRDQGFAAIDSFNRAVSWIFLFKKDAAAEFAPRSAFTEGIYDRATILADCFTPDTLGYITSPLFGPAKTWKQLHWRGTSLEQPSNDNPTVDVIGVDSSGVQTKLYTVSKTQQDFDISSVSAVQYPYIQLQLRNVDSVTLTPYQLRYWRLDYDPVPEGALTPNLFFTGKDTLEIGEKLNFGMAFKNISQAPFDSLKVKLAITDKDNVVHDLPLANKKPLVSGDTIQLRYELDTKDYPGLNTLYLNFNPNGAQQEQYYYNNFVYRNFYVRPDKVNPLMDVTFDGIHILNRDLVSSRPHIQIKLKDEAKFLLLNDTSLLNVQVRFPDQNYTTRTYRFDNDTLRFIPAQNGTDNTATIEFSPAFEKQFNAEGDEYELIVKGKDRSNNKAGETEYRITFRVINKPMISNLLNYPNPFTTSTAFVFTLTGNEIPQNMKIQVLTVTGKIVREITKEELGPIHIGRNITEFKWDGTDQFGQRLANGVYLYRVVTTLHGRQMDKYKGEGDDTDKFFNRGYGKMYLMR